MYFGFAHGRLKGEMLQARQCQDCLIAVQGAVGVVRTLLAANANPATQVVASVSFLS